MLHLGMIILRSKSSLDPCNSPQSSSSLPLYLSRGTSRPTTRPRLVAPAMVAELANESSPGSADRLQAIIVQGLQAVQDPVSLVIDTLVTFSAVAETTRMKRNAEWAVTQFLVRALRGFMQGSSASSSLLDDDEGLAAVNHIRPLQPIQLWITAPASRAAHEMNQLVQAMARRTLLKPIGPQGWFPLAS